MIINALKMENDQIIFTTNLHGYIFVRAVWEESFAFKVTLCILFVSKERLWNMNKNMANIFHFSIFAFSLGFVNDISYNKYTIVSAIFRTHTLTLN